ncbi:unnamed protein product, partial [Pleuronectes platessa]
VSDSLMHATLFFCYEGNNLQRNSQATLSELGFNHPSPATLQGLELDQRDVHRKQRFLSNIRKKGLTRKDAPVPLPDRDLIEQSMSWRGASAASCLAVQFNWPVEVLLQDIESLLGIGKRRCVSSQFLSSAMQENGWQPAASVGGVERGRVGADLGLI